MPNTDWKDRAIINLTVKSEALMNESFVYYVALLLSAMGSAYGEIIINGKAISIGGGDTLGDVVRKCSEMLYPALTPRKKSKK